jgi:hypothetical protein
MKKHLELIVIFLAMNLMSFAMYLIGVFYNCSWDRCLWADDSRYCISFLIGIFSILSIVIPIIAYSTDDK